jgi:hypothetical protein
MTEIERVVPADGLRAVEFDYAAASTALAAVGAAAAALGEHGTAIRTATGEAVVNWQGDYRIEFDRAHWLLDRRVLNGLDTLHSARRAIHRAIDDANEWQRSYNAAHEQSLTSTSA